MSWMDDWLDGHIDCWTAFTGFLDGRDSPSARAREECGCQDPYGNCKHYKTKEYAREEMKRGDY